MPINYQNSKIYKICSSQTDDVYIGATTESLAQKMAHHRAAAKNGGKHLGTIFQYEDAHITLIQDYPCENKEQLMTKKHQIMQSTTCINKLLDDKKTECKRVKNAKYYTENKKKWEKKKNP